MLFVVLIAWRCKQWSQNNTTYIVQNQHGDQGNAFPVSGSSRFFISVCLKLSMVSFALPCAYRHIALSPSNPVFLSHSRIVFKHLEARTSTILMNYKSSFQGTLCCIRHISHYSDANLCNFVCFHMTDFFFVFTEILLDHNTHLQIRVHCMLQSCPIWNHVFDCVWSPSWISLFLSHIWFWIILFWNHCLGYSIYPAAWKF